MADRTVSVDFVARHAGFTSGVQSMKRDVTDLRSSIAQSARTNEADWNRLGRAGVVAGGAMAAGLGVAVAQFHGFQREMNRVGALTGATGEQFEQLGGLAQELGRTTVFTASQSADALGFLAMAGFDANTAMEALPETLTLAAAAGMDLARAADITTNILTGYGMETAELAHANDVLTATFTSSNTSMEQLGDAMAYAAPVASAAGIEFEEASAAMGLMGNAGIQGARAGTSLRGALTRLLNPTGAVADTLDRLGVQVLDADDNMLSLVEIVDQLGSSGATTGEIMQIFGQRAGPAMAALLSQGSEELATFTEDLRSSGGIAEEIADRQLEGLHGSLIRFKSAAEGAAIALGEGLAPAIGWVADVGTKLLAFYGALPGPLQTAIAMTGAAAAGTLLLGGAFMLAVPRAVAMHASFLALTGSTTALAGAKLLLNRAMSGGVVAFTGLLGMVTPFGVALGAAAVAVGGLLWWLNRAQVEQQAAGDAAQALASSVGLAYDEIGAAGEGMADNVAQAAQSFATANAETLGQLQDLEAAAAADYLFQIGYDLVQHGADPDEAMAAVERLRDSTNPQITLDFDASDLNDVDRFLATTSRRIEELAGDLGFFATTSENLQAALRDVGSTAADTFNADPVVGFADAIAKLAGAQNQLEESGAKNNVHMRELIDTFIDTTGIEGFEGRIRDVDTLLGQMADGTAAVSPEVRDLAAAFVEARDAGEPTEFALRAVAEAIATMPGVSEEAKDALVGLIDPTGELGVELEGLGDAAAETSGPLTDLGYDLEQLGNVTEEAAEKWAALAGEFLDAGQAMTRANEENQAAAEAAAEAHNAAIDDQIAKLGEGETEQRESLQNQKKNWEDFAGDFPATIGQVTSHLEDVNEEFRRWQGDLQTIAQDVGGDMATRLAMMGPEWAPIVAEAVDATASELAALDQAMVDNIDLQMAAAEMAVQMEIFEEIVRQGGNATAQSIAESTGIAVEVVEGIWSGLNLDPVELAADSTRAFFEIDATEMRARAYADEEFVAWVNANIDPADRKFYDIEMLARAYQDSNPEATLFADTGPAESAFGDGTRIADAWAARVDTSTIAGDLDPASGAFRAGQALAEAWGARTDTSTIDGDEGPASGAFGTAAAVGRAWDLRTDTSTIDADDDPARRAIGSFQTWVTDIFRNPWTATISATVKAVFGGFGDANYDGPGGGGGGGQATARARRAMQGLPTRITSTYRSPAHNRRVGGAPRSLHMDRANPATDIGGPTWALDIVHNRLRSMGGNRQLIWRAPGHWDHVHVAHEGATVEAGWPTLPGLGAHERPAVLEVGEEVLAKREAQAYRDPIGAVPRYHSGTVPTSGASSASVAGQLARTVAALEGIQAEMDRTAKQQQVANMKQAVFDARKEARTADTPEARKRAREQEAEASKRYAEFLAKEAQESRKIQAEIRKVRQEEELRIATNRESWQFSRMSSAGQLRDLERRLSAERYFTDEWMQLDQQRQQILDRQAADAKATYDEAWQSLNAMLDEREAVLERIEDLEARHVEAVASEREQIAGELNRLLDDRRSVLDRMEQAETDYADRVAREHDDLASSIADSRARATDEVQRLLDSRRGELRASLSVDFGDDDWNWSATSIADQLEGQVRKVEEWAQSLAELRARGVSQDAIELLGVDSSPEALGQIQVLLRSSDAELRRLTEAAQSSQQAIRDRADAEQLDATSQLGRDVLDIEQAAQDEQAQLRADHLDRLAELEAEHAAEQVRLAEELQAIGVDQALSYSDAVAAALESGLPGIVAAVDAGHDRLLELEGEFHDDLSELNAEMAMIGIDTGRSYTDAIEVAMRSGLPGLIAQAEAIQAALREVKEAEAAAEAPASGALSRADQIRQVWRDAGVSLAFGAESEAQRLARLVAGGRTIADLRRSAQIQYVQHPHTRLHDGGFINLPAREERVAVLRGQEVVQPVDRGFGGPQVVVVERTVEVIPDGTVVEMQSDFGEVVRGTIRTSQAEHDRQQSRRTVDRRRQTAGR